VEIKKARMADYFIIANPSERQYEYIKNAGLRRPDILSAISNNYCGKYNNVRNINKNKIKELGSPFLVNRSE